MSSEAETSLDVSEIVRDSSTPLGMTMDLFRRRLERGLVFRFLVIFDQAKSPAD